MITKRFQLHNFLINNKTVFLRVDYNIPLKDNKILNNTKIKASLNTIKFLLEKNCKIILATHIGDPKGKVISNLSTKVILKELKDLLPNEKIFWLEDCIGKEIKEKITQAKPIQIFLLENLRFYKEEEENDFSFAHSLADLAQVYVNEAFAVCHRKHASVSAITNFIPAVTGINLEQEITNLNKALIAKKPAVWIMGGAKLDKVNLIQQALKKADKILVGGALAFAFLSAKRIKVGMSKLDAKSIIAAKEILSKDTKHKIILPLDFKVADKFSSRANSKIVDFNEIENNQIALDIGPKTIELFKKHLSKAKTIVWNGPLGYFEWADFSIGTKEIGRYLGKIDAIKICGGGETTQAIHKFYLTHNFTHVSTGGGASLAFLSGERLPGIDALLENYQKFRSKFEL